MDQMHQARFQFFKKIRQRQGVFLILGAAVFTTLLILTGAVVDLGMAYVSNSELQKSADAAAWATSSLLPVKATDLDKKSQIEDMARQYLAKNDSGEAVLAGVEFGNDFTDTQNGIPVTLHSSVRIKVQRKVNYLFGPIIGIRESTLTRHAKVQIKAVIGGVPLVPLGISQTRRAESQNGRVAITFDPGSSDVVNGAFGFLDLDAKQGGVPEFIDRFTNGFTPAVEIVDPFVELVDEEFFDAQKGNISNPASLAYENNRKCLHSPKCTPTAFVPNCRSIVTLVVYTVVGEPGRYQYKPVGFAPYILESFAAVDNSPNKVLTASAIQLRVKIGKTRDLDDFNYDFGLFRTRLVE